MRFDNSSRFPRVLTFAFIIFFQLFSANSFGQFSKVHDFGSDERYPDGSLIFDGTYLYGMASDGGANFKGAIFRVKPNGAGYDVLHDFDGTNGGFPYGSLLSDGTYLYGLTQSGGSFDYGTIFKIEPDGTGFVSLHSFDDGLGSNPYGSLVSDGTFLYGMTSSGGEFGKGTIFQIMPDGTGFTVIHEFKDDVEGGTPYGSLVLEGGVLYGMTNSGGTTDFGVAFSVEPDGNNYLPIYQFNSANASSPLGSLISDGTFLYGMTSGGGDANAGTVFKMEFDGSAFFVIHEFSGTDGAIPNGDLVYDGTFLYGMTSEGGNDDFGVSFKVKPNGTGFLKLLDFDGAGNGSFPYGSFIKVATYLYGMTDSGGSQGDHGTVFKIKTDGTGYFKIKEFFPDGVVPYGSLISDGTYLYGMTSQGSSEGYGTIFKIKPDGSEYSALHILDVGDGGQPEGPLFYDGTYLYGMAPHGGANDAGTIFKIKPDGSGFTKILDFNWSNGGRPHGGLISDGTFLYGMTAEGGNDNGIIFKIMPDGTGYSTLSDFSGTNTGYEPFGDLYYDGTFLYGMTKQGGANGRGTIFRLQTDGSGYVNLLDFDEIPSGSYPQGSLISDGTYLYGMASGGGVNDIGTIFKIKPDGTGFVKLYDFAEFENNSPQVTGSLAYDGTLLYGLTTSGGVALRGSIFSMKTDGTGYDDFFSFNTSADGNYPYGTPLLLGTSSGTSLYGMTSSEGVYGGGLIFKYTLSGSASSVSIATATLETLAGGQVSLDLVSLITVGSAPLNVSSIKIIQQPTSGAPASITNGVLLIDYAGLSFVGTDHLTIEACDVVLNCAQQELTVEVAGEVTVYNAVSPNGDGKNDIFLLQYVDVIPSAKNNKVVIFDRWGNTVFETTNYDNVDRVFRGLNQSGSELPSGIYYYKLDFPDGASSKSGFISLKR